MRAYFTTPIKTVAEAHAFFDSLHAENLLFHPDDSPETIIDAAGALVFTAEEALAVSQRIDEVRKVTDDPCAYILDSVLSINVEDSK